MYGAYLIALLQMFEYAMSKLPSPRTIAVGSVCKATRIASLTAVKRFIRFVGNAAVTLLPVLPALLLVVLIEDVDRDRKRILVHIHVRFNNIYLDIIFFINPRKV